MHDLIARNLINRIKSANLTPYDVEKRSGLSLSSVRNILSGRSKNPTIETLSAIANTLGCGVDDLIRETPLPVSKIEVPTEIEQHLWVKELVLETINFVEESLTFRKYTPSFEQAMFFVKEIYSFSVGTDDQRLDKRFGEWFINKNMPTV